MKNIFVALLWLIAFIFSAMVTYYLPGAINPNGFAFVDMMGIMISLSCFALGVMYGILDFIRRNKL